MDKYIVAPPNGSTNNGIGAADRKWKEGHFEKLPNWQEYLAESTGFGIVSGCEPTISGLTVTVGAGVVHLADGTRKEIAQTNITLDNADSSNPRIDLVYIDSTGTIAKITGTAAASPSAPTLPTGGISVCNVTIAAGDTTGTVNHVQTIAPNLANYGIVNVKDFGAVGDGVTDDTEAIKAAINAGECVYLPEGHYVLSDCITINKDITIIGNGEKSILDFGNSITGSGGKIAGIHISGELEQIANIDNADIGDWHITFTADHGLSAGDVICIYNPTNRSWSTYRNYYRAGEWCKVVRVNGLTVDLENALYDSYTGSAVSVYKMNSRSVRLENFKIQGTDSYILLYVTKCKNVRMNNIYSELAGYTCVEIDKCFDVCIDGLSLQNTGTNSDDYGLCIGNSQNVQVVNGSYGGRRHGIAIGGNGEICSVTNRNLRINNATIYSTQESNNSQAADMHGNVEDVEYNNCTIYGSCCIAGKNTGYNNCHISCKNGAPAVWGAELKGGNIYFKNCHFYSLNDDARFGILYITFNDGVTEDINTIVENCVIKSDATSKKQIVYIDNYTTSKTNININGLDISTQERVTVLKAKNNIETEAADYVVIDNIIGKMTACIFYESDTNYLKSKITRLMRTYGKATVTIPVSQLAWDTNVTNLKYSYPGYPVAICGINNWKAHPYLANIGGNSVKVGAIRDSSISTTSELEVTVYWEVFWPGNA